MTRIADGAYEHDGHTIIKHKTLEYKRPTNGKRICTKSRFVTFWTVDGIGRFPTRKAAVESIK